MEVLHPRRHMRLVWRVLFLLFLVFAYVAPEVGTHPSAESAANYSFGSYPQDGVNPKEVLFAARTLVSESDRMNERRLVMWTIRNRVESKYRGDTTYTDVVLETKQYSGWDKPHVRERMLRLSWETKDSLWQETLTLAHEIMQADPVHNPLPGVMHFYSPVSMEPVGRVPHWAVGRRPFMVIPGITEDRFRFYI